MEKEIFTKKELEEMEAMKKHAKEKQQQRKAEAIKQQKAKKKRKIKAVINVAFWYSVGITIIYLMACYMETLN